MADPNFRNSDTTVRSLAELGALVHQRRRASGLRIENVCPYDWAKFASATGTPRSLLAREMRRVAKAAPAVATKLSQSDVYVEDEKPLVRRIAEFVAAQATRLSEMAKPMLDVEAASL